jgi:hypothetical protein
MQVAIESPHDDLEYILGKAQALWRNFTKYRWLFSHLKKYLSRHAITNGEGDDIDFNPYV